MSLLSISNSRSCPHPTPPTAAVAAAMKQPSHNHHHHNHRRRLSTCHRHPSRPITGFCAACLRERLAGIDPDTHQETPLTYLAAELRRSKSYSSSSSTTATTNPNGSSTSTSSSAAAIATAEPRRKSCDIRTTTARSTLSDLFHVDDRRRNGSNRKAKALDSGFELKEEVEEENGAEIRVSKGEALVGNEEKITDVNAYAFLEEEEEEEEEEGRKTMKEFIDLEWERKRNAGRDLRDVVAGSLKEAASAFSRKLKKWQEKQREKKKGSKHGVCADSGGGLGGNVKKLRETQSEIGEYGFGRRSCDTDPRLSVDIARLSVDDSRYSFDEPRASWDGYFVGKSYPRLTPLVSVMEDVKSPSGRISENPEDLKNEGESSPGGTVQTRDYYFDRRRRRSFDRSGSNRRVGSGDDDLKSVSNTKVSPETVGLFHGAKLLVTEKELRDSNWYSVKGCHLEGLDSLSKDVDSVAGGVIKKGGFKFKKSHRWRSVLNIWGLMPGRSERKCEDDENSIAREGVDGPMQDAAKPWQKLGGVANGEANGVVSQKLRSCSVSARDSSRVVDTTRGVETKDDAVKKREELVLRRNRSARYSPSNLDNGLLRFYLTPVRSYGRSKSGINRLKNSNTTSNAL